MPKVLSKFIMILVLSKIAILSSHSTAHAQNESEEHGKTCSLMFAFDAYVAPHIGSPNQQEILASAFVQTTIKERLQHLTLLMSRAPNLNADLVSAEDYRIFERVTEEFSTNTNWAKDVYRPAIENALNQLNELEKILAPTESVQTQKKPSLFSKLFSANPKTTQESENFQKIEKAKEILRNSLNVQAIRVILEKWNTGLFSGTSPNLVTNALVNLDFIHFSMTRDFKTGGINQIIKLNDNDLTGSNYLKNVEKTKLYFVCVSKCSDYGSFESGIDKSFRIGGFWIIPSPYIFTPLQIASLNSIGIFIEPTVENKYKIPNQIIPKWTHELRANWSSLEPIKSGRLTIGEDGKLKLVK